MNSFPHVLRKKLTPDSCCMLQILSTKVARKYVYGQLIQMLWSWLLSMFDVFDMPEVLW